MAATDQIPLYNKLPRESHRIRLLTVVPNADETAIVECILTEADLDDDNTKYDALSYCWGNPNVTKTLLVNGYEKQATVNLDDALRQFRSDSYPDSMVIWADAICINQYDWDERGHQVKIMGDIYRKARAVRAWLGKGDEIKERGLKAIDRLSRCRCIEDPPERRSFAHQASFHPCDEDLYELAFVSVVCQAAYWRRVWIVQELALARQTILHQGTYHAEVHCWDSLRYFLRLCQPYMGVSASHDQHAPELLSSSLSPIHAAPGPLDLTACPSAPAAATNILPALRPISEAREITNRNPDQAQDILDLMSLLNQFRLKEATDDRDRIYGLLGLLKGYVDIVPNHAKTVEEVFEDAVVQIIQSTDSLNVLNHCDPRGNVLPSWVPDFRVPNPLYINSSCQIGTRFPLPLKDVLRVSHPRQGVLKMSGIYFDTVKEIVHRSKRDIEESLRHQSARLLQILDDTRPEDRDFSIRDKSQRLLESFNANIHFKTSRGLYGMMAHTPHAGDHLCILATPSASSFFCIRDTNSKIQLAHSLVGTCAVWRNYDPDTSLSPLDAMILALELKHGGNWRTPDLFQPILPV